MQPPARMPQLALPFAVVGGIAGWISTGLLRNPLVELSLDNGRPLAVISSTVVGAAVGAYMTRSRAEVTAWSLPSATWIRLAIAVMLGGAVAGGCVGGLSAGAGSTVVSGTGAGVVCAIAFLPVCAVVVAAARRAERARMGSLVASADRRAVWSILATAAAATTTAAALDWPAAATGGVIPEPWAAVGIALGCALVIGWVMIADGFALTQVARAARRAADMEPRTPRPLSDEASRADVDVVDFGLGAEGRAAFAQRGSAYRGHARTVALVLGDPAIARSAIRTAIARGVASLLVIGAVLAAHRYAARPQVVVDFLEHRCRSGKYLGYYCRVAAAALEPGGSSVVAPDMMRAASLHQRACKEGVVASCVDLSRVIERGDLPAFDRTKAFELRNAACRGGDGASCRTAAHFLLNAEPPYRVLGEVSTLLDRGCKHGDAASCDDLPVVRGAPPDSILPRDAVRCLGGSLGACVLAAGTGRGPEAAQLWERACQHGGGWHCTEAAWRYRAPQWRCDESNVCRYIDHPHGAEGTGLRRAVQLYERGCELGFGMACCEAAYLRVHGDPGSRDRQLADKLYARAAAAGFERAGACDVLRAEGVR